MAFGLLGEFEAGHQRHHLICEDHRHFIAMSLQIAHRGRTFAEDGDIVAVIAQHFADEIAHRHFIVQHHDASIERQRRLIWWRFDGG
jgi:hypothetical protein